MSVKAIYTLIAAAWAQQRRECKLRICLYVRDLLEQVLVLGLRELDELVVRVEVEVLAEERRLELLDGLTVVHAADHLDHLAAVVAAWLRDDVHRLPVLFSAQTSD